MNALTEFKDLFSHQSSDYARFRPTYPDVLFQYLASLVDEHDLAWDCGTGNGQAAVKLADSFESVLATDPSAKQISGATWHPNIEYRVGTAEKPSFRDLSVDLITVAQAFHWLRADEFFPEVNRVLKPGGVLALWCYELCQITPNVDSRVLQLYQETLGGYWEPERKLVEEGYRYVRLPSPFQEIAPPPFEMNATWSLEHLIGYLSTWSALQAYFQKNRINPLEGAFSELRAAWGNEVTRPVRWQLAFRVGRKPKSGA